MTDLEMIKIAFCGYTERVFGENEETDLKGCKSGENFHKFDLAYTTAYYGNKDYEIQVSLYVNEKEEMILLKWKINDVVINRRKLNLEDTIIMLENYEFTDFVGDLISFIEDEITEEEVKTLEESIQAKKKSCSLPRLRKWMDS